VPPRIVRNAEAAANYGLWVADLRREATRKAHDRHRARGSAGRASPGVAEHKASDARHKRVAQRGAAGAATRGTHRPSEAKQRRL
jgi:hypothetical protein